MRIIGICPNCGASMDAEINCTGKHPVSPWFFCECTGPIVGCSLMNIFGGELPTMMQLHRIPDRIDVDE